MQCGLEGFSQTLLDVLAHLETVHYHLDVVFAPKVEARCIVELVDFPVDAGTQKTLSLQAFEQLHMLALAVADHRRQQHQPKLGR